MYDYTSTKYKIHLSFHTDGLVERPDVVGAIFGQTEGLLGEELDLRELQRMGKVGRIDVQLQSANGEADGSITISSALDLVETAVLAASMETIERIGPCIAAVEVTIIEDIRVTKRNQIRERAKILLLEHVDDNGINTEALINEIRESQRIGRITTHGSEELPAGPHIDQSDAIILVEGRADVVNLLRAGIKNTLAVQGTNIPQTVIDTCRQKIVTTFFDGDRGGDLILQELLQVADIDFVAFSPRGISVEDMSRKEITKALRNKVPIEYVRSGQIEQYLKIASISPVQWEGERDERKEKELVSPMNMPHEDLSTQQPNPLPDAVLDPAFQKKEKKREQEQYQRDFESQPLEEEKNTVPDEKKRSISVTEKMWNTIYQTADSGTLALLDLNGEPILKGNASDVIKVLTETVKVHDDANMLIVDTPITQALVDLAVNTHIKVFAAPSFTNLIKQPVNIQLISFST
ncbi:MAG: DNA primase [Methanomicrobiales archaeon]|jgi:DNA primase|nr:DNA primase [Methanomicrobiales archaeon]